MSLKVNDLGLLPVPPRWRALVVYVRYDGEPTMFSAMPVGGTVYDARLFYWDPTRAEGNERVFVTCDTSPTVVPARLVETNEDTVTLGTAQLRPVVAKTKKREENHGRTAAADAQGHDA